MNTEVQQNYRVEFNSNQYRLICLALAGKLKDSEDIAAALELNVQMCRQRTHVLNMQLETAAAALRNAELIQNPNIPPTEIPK